MKCVICKHGDVQPDNVTVTLEQHGTTVVIKSVPARVCETCGEQYVDENIASELLGLAKQAAHAGIQLEVRAFLAA